MMKDSKTPQEGSSPARYGFEIFFKEDGKYYFRFNDEDGQPVLFSKSYGSEKSCANGLQALLRAAGIEEQYDLRETRKGKYFFILKSGNHKEIGRSRMFDSPEELEEKVELIKCLPEDVPQYGPEDNPPAPADTTAGEEKAAKEAPRKAGEEKEPAKAPESQPAQLEGVEKMPRYKFSVIYYPDSKIWRIKNDFSGDSMKLETCDGQRIEAFLKAQLPAEENEAISAGEERKASVQKAVAAKGRKPAWGEAELKIRSHQGELLQKFAEKARIGKVELIPDISKDVCPLAFRAEVMARSLDDNKTVVIGVNQRQKLVDGRFDVPVYGAEVLKPGLYMLIANIYEDTEEGQLLEYYGSQLVMMN